MTKNGEPIKPGFTLSEVAPERWWAVTSTGEIMDQLTFNSFHERVFIETYTLHGQPIPESGLREIPAVANYVNRRVSGRDASRLEIITRGYEGDPDPVRPIYNANGELIVEAEKQPAAPVGFEQKEPPKPPEGDLEQAQEEGHRMIEMACGQRVSRMHAAPARHTKACDVCKAHSRKVKEEEAKQIKERAAAREAGD